MKLNNAVVMYKTSITKIKELIIYDNSNNDFSLEKIQELYPDKFKDEILCSIFSLSLLSLCVDEHAKFIDTIDLFYFYIGFTNYASIIKAINEFYKIDSFKYDIEEIVLTCPFFIKKLLPYIPVP